MPAAEVTKLHPDEVDISADLVTRLLRDQMSHLAGLPVRLITSSGTDNVTFLLGDELAVRLPRTTSTRGQVEKDLRWLPVLAQHLPLPVPEPVALGAPSAESPFTWGVYRWLPGTTYAADSVDDQSVAARDLAGFVRALQSVDVTDAPTPPEDPFSRGTPLAPRDGLFRAAVDELRDDLDAGLLTEAWDVSLPATPWDGPARWVHGDLMAGNVLVHAGRISAVIDFGTAWAADPAADVCAAWWLFDGDARREFRAALGVDEPTWVRARGWALSLEVIALPYYRRSDPGVVARRAPLIADLLADFTAEA